MGGILSSDTLAYVGVVGCARIVILDVVCALSGVFEASA